MSFSLYIHTQSLILIIFKFTHTPNAFWTQNLTLKPLLWEEKVPFELEHIGRSFFPLSFFNDLHLNLTTKQIFSTRVCCIVGFCKK